MRNPQDTLRMEIALEKQTIDRINKARLRRREKTVFVEYSIAQATQKKLIWVSFFVCQVFSSSPPPVSDFWAVGKKKPSKRLFHFSSGLYFFLPGSYYLPLWWGNVDVSPLVLIYKNLTSFFFFCMFFLGLSEKKERSNERLARRNA